MLLYELVSFFALLFILYFSYIFFQLRSKKNDVLTSSFISLLSALKIIILFFYVSHLTGTLLYDDCLGFDCDWNTFFTSLQFFSLVVIVVYIVEIIQWGISPLSPMAEGFVVPLFSLAAIFACQFSLWAESSLIFIGDMFALCFTTASAILLLIAL